MGFFGDWSGWTQNNTTERHMKVKRIDYICKSWRREAWHGPACRGHMGKTPREWAQPGRWGAQREWHPWTSAFSGVRWSTPAKGMRGFYCCIWMSLGHSQGGQGRELVAVDSLITLVHLVSWARYSQPICGYIETIGKQEVLKIYNQGTSWRMHDEPRCQLSP